MIPGLWCRSLYGVRQLAKIQCRGCDGVCSSHVGAYFILSRNYGATGNWQRRKQQLYLRHQYPSPFTLPTMTGGGVYEALLAPSAIPPLPLWNFSDATFKKCHVRLYSTKPPSSPTTPTDENHNVTKSTNVNIGKEEVVQVTQDEIKKEENLSLVQKFKLMYKQYWYVLLPVHVVTSVVWYGSFFIAAKSGVDIVPVLEKIGASEKILSHLRDSNAGYYAIAYAMYKIATPARYTVTIGGTTLSINYLKKQGYIKPVPTSDQLKEMYEGKKEEFIERRDDMIEKYQERKDKMVERRDDMIGKYHEQKDKMVERRDDMIEKYQERKDKYVERREEIIQKYQDKKDKIVERYQERREEMVDRYQKSKDDNKESVMEKTEQIKDKVDEKGENLGNLKDNLRKRR